MEIKKIKDVVIKREEVIGVKCDVCKKDIHGKYWNLCTSHNDWGSDSYKTLKQFDLCSKECIKTKLQEYFKNCDSSYTQRFELEQDSFDD